jgi:hypothetical protein
VQHGLDISDRAVANVNDVPPHDNRLKLNLVVDAVVQNDLVAVF